MKSSSNVIKREFVIKSLIEAGYNRARMVYDNYIENKVEYTIQYIQDSNFNLKTLQESFLSRFLSDGRPNPQSMKDDAWPDNLNQIFCDNYDEVILDSHIFTDHQIDTAQIINELLSYDEQWIYIEKGAESFIEETYGKEYTN